MFGISGAAALGYDGDAVIAASLQRRAAHRLLAKRHRVSGILP
jgi:hypothetical protein